MGQDRPRKMSLLGIMSCVPSVVNTFHSIFLYVYNLDRESYTMLLSYMYTKLTLLTLYQSFVLDGHSSGDLVSCTDNKLFYRIFTILEFFSVLFLSRVYFIILYNIFIYSCSGMLCLKGNLMGL